MMLRRSFAPGLAGLAAVILLAGCGTVPEPADAPTTPEPTDAAGWHAVPLPGKEQTSFARVVKDGRPAWQARSTNSASMWRLKLDVPADRLGAVSFSWWVDSLIAGASIEDALAEDAPARVILAFAGDTSTLPARTRMQFELAEALTGERPPYATLMYVFETSLPVDSVVVNPRTDRIRKIVVDSGSTHLRRWRDHRRDIVADFRRAFGEDPGPLVAVAVMTDTDNTRSRALTWYGPVTID
jgi:hypothetical protein